jgi:hypothetical protein
MLRRVRDFEDWTVSSRDGDEVGTVRDSYFDDERWTVRYVVVDAGSWLAPNPILISPMAIERLDADRSRLDVRLTREQIRQAPSAGTERPLSRRFEAAYAGYYGYPWYWTGPALWGPYPMPAEFAAGAPPAEGSRTPSHQEQDTEDSHLRSVNEVVGYHLQALDGEIGHIDDFMVDGQSWTVRYLVIDTSNWIGGRIILVSPEWVRRVEWPNRLVYLDMTTDAIRNSPEYNPTTELTGDYEERLHEHYKRPAYSCGEGDPRRIS